MFILNANILALKAQRRNSSLQHFGMIVCNYHVDSRGVHISIQYLLQEV